METLIRETEHVLSELDQLLPSLSIPRQKKPLSLVLYAFRIFDYTKDSIIIAKQRRTTSLSLVTRSVLETYVDFYNINRHDDYLMRLHLSSLLNKIKPFEQNLISKSILQLLSNESKKHYESMKLEIVELKNNNLKKLDIKEKFNLADSQDIHSNVYWTLCEDSHNGLGFLHEKYITGNSESFTFITDKFSDQKYLNPFLTSIIGAFSSTLKILSERLSEFKSIADLATQTIDPLLPKE